MERRRFPRWRSDGAEAYLYVRGQSTRRCKISSVSKAGLFIEIDAVMPMGLAIELALTRAYTRQVVKLYRRSAYVTRVSQNGVAVLFFAPREVPMQGPSTSGAQFDGIRPA